MTEPEATEQTTAPTTEVEIIEDDEVPLANKPGDGTPDGTPSVMPFVGGGIGLLALIVLVILFVDKKRRNA